MKLLTVRRIDVDLQLQFVSQLYLRHSSAPPVNHSHVSCRRIRSVVGVTVTFNHILYWSVTWTNHLTVSGKSVGCTYCYPPIIGISNFNLYFKQGGGCNVFLCLYHSQKLSSS